MSRLFDRIKEGVSWPPFVGQDVKDGVYRLVVEQAIPSIEVGNVADYYFGEWDKYSLARKDYLPNWPNLAPPFSDWFCSYRLTPSMSRQVNVGLPDYWIDGLGVLFQAHENTPDEAKPWRWTCISILFHDVRGIPLALGAVTYRVMPDGSGWRSDEADRMCFVDPVINWTMQSEDIAEHVQSLEWTIWHALYPSLLAISFMHCKNVNLIPNEADEKLQRAREKRGKKPLARYYTLEIEPMKEVLRREGNIEKTGLKQALHICRGHFKDYRERGLFGRNKGLYWWDQQVRGSLSEGVVVKDYAVKQPKQG